MLPGLIDPKSCKVGGLKTEYMAGEEISFYIISKDSYENTTWHRSKPWDIQIPSPYSFEESIDYCSTKVKFASIKAFLVPIKISYENFVILNTNIKVLPGPVFIPHTVVDGEGAYDAYFFQPVVREFSVEFFDNFCNPTGTSIELETNLKFEIVSLAFNKFVIRYQVFSFGEYKILIITNNGKLPIDFRLTKDPKLVQIEKQQQELEKTRLRLAREQEIQEKEEQKRRAEEEKRRNFEIKQKQALVDKNLAAQKEMEDAEMRRRQRIVERIKMQEVTKKRGIDALKTLEEEKKKKEVKKWRRTGGGFSVPFVIED